MNPLVTIAIPTYRRLAYLQEAVASALAQSYPHIEVLVSQDPTSEGPDPAIRAWCLALAEQEPRLSYRCNAQNLGLAGNWNAAIQAARGQYVTIIGDDDRLLPAFVERLLPGLSPGISVAFANHYLIDALGNRLLARSEVHTATYHRANLSAGEIADPESCAWQNAVPMLASLIAAEPLQRLGFKIDLNTPEVEFFVRLAQEGGRFYFCPEYLAEYRVHLGSATQSGLTSEVLARYLIDLPASPQAERHKRALLASLLPNAVSRHLRRGERELARKLLASSYYPDGERVTGIALVQRFCTALPEPVGCSLYRTLYFAGRQLRL
ncbi:glycosyltransferase family 2 protein [Gloeobacter kilaueensis]|uniref:Glycosyl transferase family 2 n=1 Tax=Gloeobacter kilaueensis (strain ATCC BAA-2537 / CCAP 1431/1 / ULC 316 / JS1) TaxID=1183438 RepID=U5QLB1_GLOK1|nr:glycosyltransferase family 2 protein [Gloeobacter kilaueensis]AGY59721.1 glycosyl transferase family 2 [Gloeobacter kilaueensis JS1]